MLIGLIALSFSSLEASSHTPKIEANGDTVIIKFGKNSRLELHIADAEDRKVLSELDLNALVAKVNAYMNTQSTTEQPIYSEAHPAENAELVASQNMQASITAVHPTKTEKSMQSQKVDCQDNRNTKLVWNFDVGFNNYQQNGRAASAIAQDLQTWRSNYFAISASIRTKVSEHTNLRIGTEMAWNSLSFVENTVLETSEAGTIFGIDTFEVDKSKLNISYLSLPLMLEFTSTKKWTFGVGGHLGYRIGSHFKRTYRTEGINKTEKEYHTFGLNDLRYGLRSEVGYDGWRLFMNYDLNALFSGTSPDLQLVSFGVRM